MRQEHNKTSDLEHIKKMLEREEITPEFAEQLTAQVELLYQKPKDVQPH